MTKYEIGQQVILVHTGVKATIVRFDEHDIVIVHIEEDHSEIPVFLENIESLELWQTKQSKTTKSQDNYLPFVSEPIKNEQLLFTLVPSNISAKGVAAKYELILVNATSFDLYVEMDILFGGEKEFTISERVKAFTPLKVDEFTPLDFGDKPSVRYNFQRIMTAGIEPFLEGETKLKDKTLLKSKIMIPLLDFPAISIALWQKDKATPSSNKEKSLKDYTKQNAKLKPKKVQRKTFSGLYNPLKKANFPTSIDLHIERLAKNHKNLSNAQIVQIQIKAMTEYVDEAYQLGMDSVFLVHGVGKGYLKNAIHQKLRDHPHIMLLKNEYHHKFGYGATEVIFL